MERVRDDQMILRVSMDERVKIVDASTERDTTISQFIRDAVDFYLAFPLGMPAEIKKATEGLNIEPKDIIPRLFLVYAAADAAIVKNFGISKTYDRALRFDEKGTLMKIEKISDNTFSEVDAVCKEVLKKMKWTAAGKQTLLSKEEGSYVPVLHEAKQTPMARAKSAK